jgi:hypothetical protein
LAVIPFHDLANDTGARKLRVVSRETGMSFDVVLNDLKAIYQAPSGVPHSGNLHLAEDDIRRWIALMGEPRSVLYDRIATYLARGFHSSELPFAFCDAVVNDICGVMTLAGENRPELFWEVYLAFDKGSITTIISGMGTPSKCTPGLELLGSSQTSITPTRDNFRLPASAVAWFPHSGNLVSQDLARRSLSGLAQIGLETT